MHVEPKGATAWNLFCLLKLSSPGLFFFCRKSLEWKLWCNSWVWAKPPWGNENLGPNLCAEACQLKHFTFKCNQRCDNTWWFWQRLSPAAVWHKDSSTKICLTLSQSPRSRQEEVQLNQDVVIVLTRLLPTAASGFKPTETESMSL